MKLIDLLVQELPKRGGWPKGANFAVQDINGAVKFANTLTHLHYLSGEWRSNEDGHDWIYRDRPFDGNFITKWTADDNHRAVISMARYEREIMKNKTSKQPANEWNGEGIPPVGTKCRIIISDRDFGECEILFVGESLLVWRQDSTYQEGSGYHRHMKFRPIRTEAERKRDAAAEAIHRYMPEFIPDTPNEYYHAKKIYDAIAAGKIPGVKLDD